MEQGREVGDVDYRGNPRVQTINDDPSMTVQSDAHLADINEILRSFSATGMDMLNEADLMFKDVSEFTDLRDALDQAILAEVEFLKLPSKVREVFDHDVAVWLDTAHDQDKRDALVQAGFLKAVEVVETGVPRGIAATPPKGDPAPSGEGREGTSGQGSE